MERTMNPPQALDKRRNFVPKYFLRSIEELEAQVDQVRNAASRLEAFGSFSTIERVLEPVEECVNAMVWGSMRRSSFRLILRGGNSSEWEI
jgi:hypothetical protein